MSAVTCFLMLDKESCSSRSTEPKVSEDNDTKLLGLTLALGTCPLFIHSCNISGGLAKNIFPENCRVVRPEPRGLSCIVDVAASDEQGGINAGTITEIF